MDYRKQQIQDLNAARKNEKVERWKRSQADKAKREQRWTEKLPTANHPFGADEWAEDERIYNELQDSNAISALKARIIEKAETADHQKRREKALAEVDVLNLLRREKKKLQEDQKELKARLGLDQVDKRCKEAQHKTDMKAEALQDKVAGLGLLDRAHSDFFTEGRLSPDQQVQRKIDLRRMNSRSLEKSLGAPSGGRDPRVQAMFARTSEPAEPLGRPLSAMTPCESSEAQLETPRSQMAEQGAPSVTESLEFEKGSEGDPSSPKSFAASTTSDLNPDAEPTPSNDVQNES